ncbi:hypothetical protein DAEQUDRAFT_612518 [Daedalea quercina L-15889]|uniref:Uncharacterized protein n=1 Tax=Daedalea quercina L-15889 TaxID=1314783 RepID=A0A165LHU5_9APHY|nr:hypothetical protein DAEQUDRAFT_612518 [Daedalea quercina L-15889]
MCITYSWEVMWRGYTTWAEGNAGSTYPLDDLEGLIQYAKLGLQYLDVDWTPLNDLNGREEFHDLREVTIEMMYETMDLSRAGLYEEPARNILKCFDARLEEGMKQLLWQRRGMLTIVKTIDDRGF